MEDLSDDSEEVKHETRGRKKGTMNVKKMSKKKGYEHYIKTVNLSPVSAMISENQYEVYVGDERPDSEQ